MSAANDLVTDAEVTNGSTTDGDAVQVGDSATSFSSTLAGLRVNGSFSLTSVTAMDFLDSGLNNVRNLVVKLLETDRGTGNFVQLSHQAFLEVTCDFRKFIEFNGTSSLDAQDDAYQLTGITITNAVDFAASTAAGVEDGARNLGITNSDYIVSSSDYLLDLRPTLEILDTNSNPTSTENARYDNSTPVDENNSELGNINSLISHWFPSGAVLINLKEDPSISSLAPTNNGLLVRAGTSTDAATSTTTTAAESGTYQINVTQGLIGMTLYSKITIDCKKTQGSPTLTIDSSFEPDTNEIILGNGSNIGDNTITISLLESSSDIEDFTKSQKLVLGEVIDVSGVLVDVSGTTDLGITTRFDNLVISVNRSDGETSAPAATDADDFSVSINLTDLTGDLGQEMVAAHNNTMASVNTHQRSFSSSETSSELLQTFTIQVEGIAFSPTSDFSGFMRSLAEVRDPSNSLATSTEGHNAMPIIAGEKFIINTPDTISFNVIPYSYDFSPGAGSSTVVSAFNLLNSMTVYGVLKHDPTSTAPVLKTNGMSPLTLTL